MIHTRRVNSLFLSQKDGPEAVVAQTELMDVHPSSLGETQTVTSLEAGESVMLSPRGSSLVSVRGVGTVSLPLSQRVASLTPSQLSMLPDSLCGEMINGLHLGTPRALLDHTGIIPRRQRDWLGWSRRS